MRQALPTVALTGLLAGCANVHERPFVLGTAGLDAAEVLRVERADLENAPAASRVRREMSSIEAVEALRCVTLRQIGNETPRCDYRLRYRRLDGTSALKKRRNRFFARGDDGRWESVFIAMSA